MKIAVISDIHGNLVALESIARELSGAESVVCLGDVAATGPQPREAIEFIREAKWPCVMGNGDESLARPTNQRPSRATLPKGEKLRMEALDRWTASQVTASDRRFLSGFKPTVQIGRGADALLCYHGTPGSNTEGILSTTPDEELVTMFKRRRALVFAGGHTHAQMVRKLGSSLVINPGSVGLPFYFEHGVGVNPAWAEYAILTFSGGGVSVELRRRAYPLGDLKRAVERSGLPDPEWWMRDWVQP